MLFKYISFQRSHFIRCVKPNSKQIPNIFEEKFVFNQLQSSGTIAYNELMQSGYPIKLKIDEIYLKIQTIMASHHASTGKIACCHILLLAFGFKPKDFKIGKTDISIRPGKTHLLDQLHLELDKPNEELAQKFKGSHKAYMLHVYFIALRFLGSGQFTDIVYYKNISISYFEFSVSLSGKKVAEKRSLLSPSAVHQDIATDKNLETEDLHKPDIEQCHTENRLVTVDSEVKIEKKVRTEKETKPKNAIRFDKMEHWIEFDDPNEERKSFRCKHCGAQATTFCTKCNVHLCFVREKKIGQGTRKIRNCFKAFHTIEES